MADTTVQDTSAAAQSGALEGRPDEQGMGATQPGVLPGSDGIVSRRDGMSPENTNTAILGYDAGGGLTSDPGALVDAVKPTNGVYRDGAGVPVPGPQAQLAEEKQDRSLATRDALDRMKLAMDAGSWSSSGYYNPPRHPLQDMMMEMRLNGSSWQAIQQANLTGRLQNLANSNIAARRPRAQ